MMGHRQSVEQQQLVGRQKMKSKLKSRWPKDSAGVDLHANVQYA